MASLALSRRGYDLRLPLAFATAFSSGFKKSPFTFVPLVEARSCLRLCILRGVAREHHAQAYGCVARMFSRNEGASLAHVATVPESTDHLGHRARACNAPWTILCP